MFKLFATIFASSGFLYVVFWVSVAVGWVLNLMYLVQVESFTPFTGELIVRIIGVFLVPVGGFMGLFF